MASDKNTMPKGTTHIVMDDTTAQHARREADGWCLQDGEGGWVFCGEEVSGHKVDIRTGIVWTLADKEDNTRVLASVIRPKGERAIGVADLRIPSGFSDVDHLITQRFVDNWDPADTAISGPINHVEPGKKIPAVFSRPTMQELYDGPRKVIRKAFPVRFKEVDDQEPKWLPVDSAPRDGRQLRLLVEFEENSTDDALRGVTIGANYFEQNGLEDWVFAGWSWTQDCYTSGVGKVIGWLPLLTGDPKVSDPGFYGRMAARLRKRTADLRRSNDLAIKSLTATLESYERLSMSAYHAIIQAGGHCDHWRVMLLADLEYQDAKKALAELTGGNIS